MLKIGQKIKAELCTGFYSKEGIELKVNDLVLVTDSLGLDEVIYKVIKLKDGFYTEPYDLEKMPIGTERSTSGLFNKWSYTIIGSVCE